MGKGQRSMGEKSRRGMGKGQREVWEKVKERQPCFAHKLKHSSRMAVADSDQNLEIRNNVHSVTVSDYSCSEVRQNQFS